MKKVIAAMAAMFIAVVLLGGLWGILLKPIMGGGGTDLSFIYPIYIGLILLAGLIVGAAVVLYEEIKKLHEEIKNISEKTETDMETFSSEESQQAGDLIGQVQVENRDRYDYREFLRKFSVLREEVSVDPDSFDYIFYSYGLSMYGNMPLIEPQEWKEVKKVEDFAIVIDTSMSCSGDLVKKFLEETYDVLTEAESFFHKVNIHIIQCDEMVQNDQKITDEKELKEYMEHLELIGEGGTDFRPAFEYVNQLIEQGEFYHLKGLIYFTDGKGTYPKKKPSYETAFIFMQEEYEDIDVPPWAVKLIVDAEDLDEGEEEHEH